MLHIISKHYTRVLQQFRVMNLIFTWNKIPHVWRDRVVTQLLKWLELFNFNKLLDDCIIIVIFEHFKYCSYLNQKLQNTDRRHYIYIQCESIKGLRCTRNTNAKQEEESIPPKHYLSQNPAAQFWLVVKEVRFHSP